MNFFKFNQIIFRPGISLLVAFFVIAGGCAVPARAADKVDFNFHIKPLLSDRCFTCHGPDENARKAKLRLDTEEGAFKALTEELRVIKAGDLERSEVYRRIIATDPEERMPPPASNLSLNAEEIDLIRRWIEQGAEWKAHWSFVPLRETEIPAVRDAAWPAHPMDHFVLARLEEALLTPSPAAARERLIRRVTFDLTGLPPTIEEVDRFLADNSPEAYERLVDRLLASSHYGERMALDWLDVARYADTHGYQADRYRGVWPWRDWVIEAFNRNLPYDKFITWQIAGDLLPDATKEQKLATAFNRLHMQTEEGGSVEEEFRVSYVTDRVNTFGTAFLGLTFDCSRCHDHKYDPISQSEYYQLFTFFNNIDESGQTSHFTDATPVPTLLLSDDATDRALESLLGRIREKEAQTVLLNEQSRGAFEQWLKNPPANPGLKGLIGDYPLDAIEGGKFQNRADADKPGEAFEEPKLVDGVREGGVQLQGENGVRFKGVGAFSRVDPFAISLWIKRTEPIDQAAIIHRTQATLDAGSRGYELILENGRISLGLHHMWPHNSIKVMSEERVPLDEWVHLTMTYDGSSRAEGLELYWNGQKAATEVVRDNLLKDILYERVAVELTLGARFRDHGFKGGLADEVKVFNRALTPVEAAQVAGKNDLTASLAHPEKLTPEEKDLFFDYYQANHNPIYERHMAELRELRRERSELIQGIPEIMVMKEMPEPRPSYILKRGAYDAPGEQVTFGTPKHVLDFREGLPRNRLGLARWLLDRENPLTARVTVNRYWQLFFGRGIVSTTDDFGSQGALPTHPELLDYLANYFIASGWDLKGLHKLIVTSATYRQASEASPELMAKDPENLLLARGPRNRLSAEIIRDQALAVSGLLVKKVGGPSVKPYQPEGLWEEKSGARYVPDTGEGLYRKSLYTFWKRTSPHPAMITFDASERNNCQVRRHPTSTPLQALILLNDPQYFEAARLISERMILEGGENLDEQLEFVFRLLTSRKPVAAEREVLKKLYEEQLELFERDPQAALLALTVGERANDSTLNPVKLAAGAALAGALLNFDEAIINR